PGTHEGDLFVQVAAAGGHFVRLGIAVPWRAALHHVGDVDLVAGLLDRLDDAVEQLAGGAHARQSLPVLLGPRSPTNISSAAGLPEPNTTFVRPSLSQQRVQPAAAAARAASSEARPAASPL